MGQNTEQLEQIKERIERIRKRENLSYGAFAESIGIQQSTLSHILNGRNKPSLDVVMKVHQSYSHIHLEWLLYGKGPMTDETATPGYATEMLPSLFDENAINPAQTPEVPEYRREIGLKQPQSESKEIVRQEIRYIEKPSRKITEIRIFFDDNTYETFKPEN